MQFADVAGNPGDEDDHPWPYAVIGLGSKGQRWAKHCHLIQEKMPFYELTQLNTLTPDNIAIIFVFANPEDIGVEEQLQMIEREINRLSATTFFFALDTERSFIFNDTTGFITTIPVPDVTLDGAPLAVQFACEIAHMGAEIELVCVDPVDISCITRGASRGVLLLGQSISDLNSKYTAVEQALRALPQDEVERAEGILVRLVGANASLEDLKDGYRAIDDVFKSKVTSVVGLNSCGRLPIDSIYAFVLVAGRAHL